MSEKVYYSDEYQDLIVGTNGFEKLDASTSTTAGDSKYWRIQSLVTATVSATSLAGDNLSGVSLPAGQEIRGIFSSVSRSSGEILVYKKKD